MAEIVRGDPGGVAQWREQMARIHGHYSEALVIGRFGRAAVYASFGCVASPIPLARTAEEMRVKRLDPEDPQQALRDIDLLGAYQRLGGSVPWLGPHFVDQSFDEYIRRDPDDETRLLLEGMRSSLNRRLFGFTIPASAKLLTPRQRLLDGVAVNTPPVGVMQVLERVAPTDRLPADWRAGYDAARAEFDAFAGSIRQSHPEEFLADAVMAPLVEFAARNTW